jgi:hypothetical protein
VSEAEREYVRSNLAQVNERLKATGQRQINPNDPEMQRRYGFEPIEEAEVIEEIPPER